MAKIKTLKIKIGETFYEIAVKCGTNGQFTFSAPASLTSMIEKLDNIKNSMGESLNLLERKVYGIINEFKDAIIKRRLVVKVKFSANGKFVKDENGYNLPNFEENRGKFYMNRIFSDGTSSLEFGYKILIEETVNDSVTYYNTIKCKEGDFRYEKRRVGNYISSNYREMNVNDEDILPFTEEIINSLNSIEEQFKNAVLFLSKLLSSNNVEKILTSGNFKLLE